MGSTVKSDVAAKKAKSKFKGGEDLPDLKDKNVQDATIKIQSAFRGFQTRKGMGSTVKAAVATKKAKSKFKGEEDLPDLKDKNVQDATIKIQSAFRGFQTRKGMGSTVKAAVATKKAKSKFKGDEDLPDLKDKNVQDATIKIQSAFRGFQTRKEMSSTVKSAVAAKKATSKLKGGEDLPDLKDKNVQDATIKIQSAFRGFQTRKGMGSTVKSAVAAKKAKSKFKGDDEDLPDLKDKDVQDATLKIQSVFRGFQTRKSMASTTKTAMAAKAAKSKFKGEEDDLPDLKSKDVQDATIKIQSTFRGFQARKKVKDDGKGAKQKKEKAKDDDMPDLNDPEVGQAAVKIQSVYRGFKTRF